MNKRAQNPCYNEKITRNPMVQGNLLGEHLRHQSMLTLGNMPHSERGAVYTKLEIVNFMIDLTLGNQDPIECRFLEPSFGTGNFILPLAKRLLSSKKNLTVPEIEDSIRGYELSTEDYLQTKGSLRIALGEAGFTLGEIEHLLGKWLVNDDFLLSDPGDGFTHAIGNPPYLRIERIPPQILRVYRHNFRTLRDRADLYVAFFEHCLNHLASSGRLTFICTDRWMKSKYGEGLRALATNECSISYYLDMCSINPFETEVTTYPAVVSIDKRSGAETLFASEPLQSIQELDYYLPTKNNNRLSRTSLAPSTAPILISSDPTLSLLRKIENQHPTLEDIGCSVSIGIATGADRVFVRKRNEALVEEEVLVPLLKAKDINTGEIVWSGNYFINPWEPNGSLRNLENYPLLKKHFDVHRSLLSQRHCVKKQPNKWYKTIDKYHASLTARHKLLVPDIRSSPSVVYEDGGFYPHHNLYYIVSDLIDLRLLRTVLNAGIMKLFVSHYSTPMQGGCYRFQAQHLRKICIPMSILDGIDIPEPADPYELIEGLYKLSAVDIDILRIV